MKKEEKEKDKVTTRVLRSKKRKKKKETEYCRVVPNGERMPSGRGQSGGTIWTTTALSHLPQ